MKVKVLDFNIQKETISPDNVLAMAEIIAFTETRYLIGYMGSRMQKLYADLYSDIKTNPSKTHAAIKGAPIHGSIFLGFEISISFFIFCFPHK